jgi:hypothetical protein
VDHSFTIAGYGVTRLAKQGLWLVSCESAFQLSRLFWRAQEMFESANPQFRKAVPTLMGYMEWYSANVSDVGAFTYDSDYVGFNLPAKSIARTLSFDIPDLNQYDVTFARIAERVSALQGGDFYLIGALSGDVARTDHEIAHGMFYLMPKYREASTKLVKALAQREEIASMLRSEGYADEVVIDETQAYLATGLLADWEHLEPIRHPFMTLFAKYKKQLIKPTKEN